jgi:hypothetical protein
LSLADSGVQKDTDAVVESFLAMRSRPAFDALPSILNHRHVSAAQRVELIRSCANYQLDPPASVEPIAAYIAAQKKETTDVKKALLGVLATPGVVRGKKADEWIRAMLIDDRDEVQKAAVAAAGTTAGGAVHAARLLAAKKLPNALRADVIAALRGHAAKDAEAAKVLAELEPKK